MPRGDGAGTPAETKAVRRMIDADYVEPASVPSEKGLLRARVAELQAQVNTLLGV